MKKNWIQWSLIVLLAAFGAACNDGSKILQESNESNPQTKADSWDDRWTESEYDDIVDFLGDSLLMAACSPIEWYNSPMSHFIVKSDLEDMQNGPVSNTLFIGWLDYWEGIDEAVYGFPQDAEVLATYRLYVDYFDYTYLYPKNLSEVYTYDRLNITIDCDCLNVWGFNLKMMITLAESITINAATEKYSDAGIVDFWIVQWRQFIRFAIEDNVQIDAYSDEPFFTFIVNGVDLDDEQVAEIARLNREMRALNYGIELIFNN